MDSYEGKTNDPTSLHKYMYVGNDPPNFKDPEGHEFDIGSIAIAVGISVAIVALSVPIGDETTSPQLQGTIAQAGARVLTNSALADLAGGDVALFKTYFGPPTNARVQQVEDNYQLISDYLQHTYIFHTSSTPNEFAHVFRNIPNEVWLGPAFFAAPSTGTDSKPGTIVHETSHLAVGTGDFAYGELGAENLAVQDPNTAMQNADNYEYFAERSIMPPAQKNQVP
jgi:peptidyl-Lys metalloendopeptidase